jgi:hypothetical protein
VNPGYDKSHQYLQIEYRNAIHTKGNWVALPQEAPSISRSGKSDGIDLDAWVAYVAYLNVARDSDYRLIRVTRVVTTEVL